MTKSTSAAAGPLTATSAAGRRGASGEMTLPRQGIRVRVLPVPSPLASDASHLDLLADPRDDLVERLGQRGRRLEPQHSPRLLDRRDAPLDIIRIGRVAGVP